MLEAKPKQVVMPEALLMFEVGGRRYPLTASSRCRTCRSDHRRLIEQRLVRGVAPADAVAGLEGDAPTARNVREHSRRGHLPVESELVRRLVANNEGTRRAQLVDIGVADRVRGLAFAAVVIEEAHRLVESGDLSFTVEDALKAARLLAECDLLLRKQRRVDEGLRRCHKAIEMILAVTKQQVTAECWSALLSEMNSDPMLRVFIPKPSAA